MIKSIYNFFLLMLVICSTSCQTFAVMSTPAKEPRISASELACKAKKQFWTNLHQGNYNKIPETSYLLTAAYLENPHDPEISALLGFTHIWAISERARLPTNDPRIINQIMISKRYFADSVQLEASDPRTLGFLGDTYLAEGMIMQDEREQVEGYFILKRAIAAWPEFNYFTAGYPMSILPANSKHFKEALNWQWKTLDLCANETVDRQNPSFANYINAPLRRSSQRACWNSWIAPHNYEGFFLNMGDMLVKSGDWQTAIKIYNNAKLSKTYHQWPYRSVLENRIQNAEKYVAVFNQPSRLTDYPKEPTIMFNSKFSCMACHQQ